MIAISPRVVTRAILFGTNMHQIVRRLGLHPRPHWWSSQRSPDPLAKKGEGKGREGKRSWGGSLLLNLSLATPLIMVLELRFELIKSQSINY